MKTHKAILLSCQLIDKLNKKKISYFIEHDYSDFFEIETYTDEPLWFRFYDKHLRFIKWNKKGDNSEDWKTYTYEELDKGKYDEIEELINCQRVDGEAPYIDYKTKITTMLEIAEFLSTNNIPFETIGAISGGGAFGRDTLGSVFNSNFWIDFFESGFSIYERNPDKEKIEEYIDRRKNLIGYTYTEFLRYEPKPPYINKTKKKLYNALIGFNK